MRISQFCKMAFASEDKLMLKFDNEGNNSIGDKGCEMLTKGKWTNLRYISLIQNKIKSEGIRHLVIANWPLLRGIDLGTVQLLRQ
jgi:hypothetical protein